MNIKYKRKCDGCTKCCDGTLTTNVNGEDVYKGRPCRFLGEKGCVIHKDRPKDPCKIYNCEWLINLNIPEWLKPNRSNVILDFRKIENILYLEVKEAGAKLSTEVLNWLLMEHLNNKINILYQMNYGWNWIGSEEFCDLQKEKFKKLNI